MARYVENAHEEVLAAAKELLEKGLVEGPPAISRPASKTATS